MVKIFNLHKNVKPKNVKKIKLKEILYKILPCHNLRLFRKLKYKKIPKIHRWDKYLELILFI